MNTNTKQNIVGGESNRHRQGHGADNGLDEVFQSLASDSLASDSKTARPSVSTQGKDDVAGIDLGPCVKDDAPSLHFRRYEGKGIGKKILSAASHPCLAGELSAPSAPPATSDPSVDASPSQPRVRQANRLPLASPTMARSPSTVPPSAVSTTARTSQREPSSTPDPPPSFEVEAQLVEYREDPTVYSAIVVRSNADRGRPWWKVYERIALALLVCALGVIAAIASKRPNFLSTTSATMASTTTTSPSPHSTATETTSTLWTGTTTSKTTITTTQANVASTTTSTGASRDFEEGRQEGFEEAGKLWSNDCSAIFDYEKSCTDNLIKRKYAPKAKDARERKAFKDGARAGVMRKIKEIQEECIGNPNPECSMLGVAAAKSIADLDC